MEEHAYLDSTASKSNDGGCSAAVATMSAGVVFGAKLNFDISARNVSDTGDANLTAAGSGWTMASASFLTCSKLNIS